MSKKRNLIFICLLILGVFLITSCLPKPPVTEGILKGQVIVPEGSKQLTGQALADATVNIIDPVTGAIIATTVTDANGYYQVFVPAGGPYLLQVVKDGVVILQITPQVEVGIEYDLGTADCSTTAVALIALAMMDVGANLADINLDDIAANPNFDDVLSNVTSIIEAGGDPTESAVIEQAVEDFLSPPAPPPPDSTPTYTVTYDGNGSTGGTVPSDTNNYEEGDSVTVLGNTGNLEKTQDGISFLFTGWNTAADGSGTDYKETDTFNMGNANVTLFAQWSAIRGTGPAGGLIFYDKGSVSDGWRYLEAAPSDQSTSAEWGCYDVSISGADGTAVGTGKQNTIDIEAECATVGIAADICANLNLSGYSDWFLPSKDELNLMYTNLKVAGVGGFADNRYWSSSEVDATHARNRNFDDGSQHSNYKNVNVYVRAVRAFRSTAPTYIVNYNANEASGGTVPSDSYHYEPGETVTVLGNTGILVKTGYTFAGWNTQADGNGTPRAEDSTFTMGASNVTLYAKWTIDRYVSKSGNNGNDGSAEHPWLTIQYALDNAPDGGTIHVANGTYEENISFPSDKVIVLKSENGASLTEINGGGSLCVVVINGCPDGTTLDGFTITGGYGGININSGGLPTIQNNTISGNDGSNGGGIYISFSTATIQDNTISGNTATNRGGGIYINGDIDGSSTIIQDNTISGNTAIYSGDDYGGGGGIYINSGGSPTIQNNTISGNETSSRGGGIYSKYSSPIIQNNNIISGNIATNRGGGIYIHYDSHWDDPIIIQNNTISENISYNCGGGIYSAHSSLTIQDNTISLNTATVTGGGIHIDTFECSPSPTIQGNTISGNTATSGGGGIYIIVYGSPTIGGASVTDTANFNTVCGNTPLPQINPNDYPHNHIYTTCP